LGAFLIQGAAEKIKRENDVRLRQLANKSTYCTFFYFYFILLVRFWALGVSRQGEFENTRNKLSTFQKNSPGKYFFGFRGVFSGVFFLTFFSFVFFVALVKRLSVRGTQKRGKKCFAGSCV
jgi:hypothetical protein